MAGSPEIVTIKVCATINDESGDEAQVKCTQTTPLGKLFEAFLSRQPRAVEAYWEYAGKEVFEHHTPADLGMTDGSELRVRLLVAPDSPPTAEPKSKRPRTEGVPKPLGDVHRRPGRRLSLRRQRTRRPRIL